MKTQGYKPVIELQTAFICCLVDSRNYRQYGAQTARPTDPGSNPTRCGQQPANVFRHHR
jgi:hypothetical protein